MFKTSFGKNFLFRFIAAFLQIISRTWKIIVYKMWKIVISLNEWILYLSHLAWRLPWRWYWVSNKNIIVVHPDMVQLSNLLHFMCYKNVFLRCFPFGVHIFLNLFYSLTQPSQDTNKTLLILRFMKEGARSIKIKTPADKK